MPEQTSFHWVDVTDLAEAHIQALVRRFYRPPISNDSFDRNGQWQQTVVSSSVGAHSSMTS